MVLENTDTIYEFKGKYAFLSNFYIEPDGTHVEGEYQASKCRFPPDRTRFEGLTPAQAKQLGKKLKTEGKVRVDWTAVNLFIMRDLVMKKFTEHKELQDKLLATGEGLLIEGNWWNDTFFGKVDNGHGEGQNWLGKILMETREYLKKQ